MTENRSGFERSRFLSVTLFVPNEGPGSNTLRRRRCGDRWLACQCSQRPSATNKIIEFPPSAAGVSEFRTQVRPQPSVTPACPTSPPNPEQLLCRNSQARSDKRGCEGRLRSSTCSKLLSIGRRRRDPVFRSPLQKAVPTIGRPANGACSANAFPYSSRRTQPAREPQR